MERKMLLTIKQRAEALAQAQGDEAAGMINGQRAAVPT
jgi:hypothetical protein